MRYYEVLTPVKYFDRAYYSYDSEDELSVGTVVNITIRSAKFKGIINKTVQQVQPGEYKALIPTEVIFNKNTVEFLKSFAEQNLLSTATLVKLLCSMVAVKKVNFQSFDFQPFDFQSSDPQSSKVKFKKLFELTEEQEIAKKQIEEADRSVLWGVTGSGKTEVFFSLIYDTINRGEQALLLLPEIAILESISTRLVKKFTGLTKDDFVVWSSKSKNKTNFERVRQGVPLIVGSRSSIFLPFKNLKLIVMDEEHDGSYVQVSPSYSTRESSILRAEIEGAKLVLASATPSSETFMRSVLDREFNLVKLETRYKNRAMPTVVIDDPMSENTSSTKSPEAKSPEMKSPEANRMVQTNQTATNRTATNRTVRTNRSYRPILSEYVKKRVKEELDLGGQVIFFLNRRGFSPFVVCKNCARRLLCCVGLNYHKDRGKLVCHKCKKEYENYKCLYCGETNSLAGFGLGVEKLHEALSKEFKDIEILALSSDTHDTPSKLKKLIGDMESKKIRILVGTQILVKGHDFPEVSLVVALNIDRIGVGYNTYETLFQTLVQVAGRAGRGDRPSEVIVETSNKNRLISALKTYDYEGFMREELEERKRWNLPPYSVLLLFRSRVAFVLDRDIVDLVQESFEHQSKEWFGIIVKIKREDFEKNRVLIYQFMKKSKVSVLINVDFSSL